MLFIYNTLLLIAAPFLYLSGFFSPKIRQGIVGRKNVLRDIAHWRESITEQHSVILINCASLGEYEQAKPLIKKIRENSAKTRIALSFVSPSGFMNFKDRELVDVVFYLPFDLPWTIRKFLDILCPSAIINTSYDMWGNLMIQADNRNIPQYLISARLRPSSSKLQFYTIRFYRRLYKIYRRIFAVSIEDYANLRKLLSNMENVIITGDTRYDGVEERYRKNKNKHLLPIAWNDKPIFILGSLHREDISVVFPAMQKLENKYPDLHVVVVPHEPANGNYEETCKYFTDTVLYSQLMPKTNPKNIFVDTIGDLASLYFSATLAYVGGGFGTNGLHNVMEPAVAGVPTFIGPRNQNSLEAQALIHEGAVFVIRNSDELYGIASSLLADKDHYEKISQIARGYITRSLGASDKIIKILKNDHVI
ncbi:MAG: glycosyltransferase N-terminal domain-containing protein [Candidatus Marinimicrobia bacterium]|nr:glycosyltransferase N-terminal domain-containing protein [Candidatus Neomarinimicrobiota bacterium]MDD5581640.1 glycosyltransferase N-terminal domain-containing protein [Candidatus Neomarinimicrobiota bacterium]